MAREHFWAYLKDQDGRPLVGSNIRVYLAGTADEATVYSLPTSAGIVSGGDKVDMSLIDQSTWVTGASGFFSFFVGNAWAPSGYTADQQFRLKWWDQSVTPTAGADLDNLPIFDFIFPVDDTDTNTSKNKMVSNQQAKTWTEHPDNTYAHLIHDYNPVDYESGSDQTVNKMVSDELMFRVNRDLDTLLLCGGDAITITASGSLVDVQTIGASAWIPSGSNYVANVTHRISRTRMFPIYQIYDSETNDIYYPVNVRDLDLESLQIISNDGTKNLKMTIVGQLQSSASVSVSAADYAFTLLHVNDDGDAGVAGGNFEQDSFNITLGNASPVGDYHAWFRFDNVEIDQGTMINEAHLSWLADSTKTGTQFIIKTFCEAEDDATAPTDGADLISRNLTTATGHQGMGAWTGGVRYDSMDLKTVIQEVIDRPGWVSGNAIQFHVIEESSDTDAYRTVNNDDTILYMNYVK